MKKINFLSKLKEEGRILPVEPNENVKESYIKKSESSLKSAKILLENNQNEDAISMAYYSMYNMVVALFYKTGIKCENHSAAIIILKELFGVDNSRISFAKTERIDKQYYVDLKTTKQDAEKIVNDADKFNSMLYDFIDKLTTKQAFEYKEEFERVLK